MKKTYINPSIKHISMQTAHMLAGSPGYGGNTNETSGNLSRKFEWDDEED